MEQTTSSLVHLAEFQNVLINYSMSASTRQTLKKTAFVLLTGPTASGRNTIITELLETGNYYYIVSDTTRSPQVRDGRMEQNGREYYFRTEDEVLKDIKEGKYIEAAVIHGQQVSGMSVRELEKGAGLDKICISEVTIDGIQNVVQVKPDTIAIFVLPPNFEEWQRRLLHRGFMSQEETHRRLTSTLEEYAHALGHGYYKFVLNDTVDNAAMYINRLARLGDSDQEYQDNCRRIAEQLYAETQVFLRHS